MAANRPLGCSAMFTGKSPRSTCRPAGRSDHWFGKRIEPSDFTPGQATLDSGLAGCGTSVNVGAWWTVDEQAAAVSSKAPPNQFINRDIQTSNAPHSCAIHSIVGKATKKKHKRSGAAVSRSHGVAHSRDHRLSDWKKEWRFFVPYPMRRVS
jgi:hypothetical protein